MYSADLEVATIDPDFEVLEYSDILSSFPPEDKCGLRVTSGSVTLQKNGENGSLIGISIGGGVPYCPCIYIVQIFDNTITALEGTLEAGDEITAVDKRNVRGFTRSEVAKIIQRTQGSVTIFYNKLHIDNKENNSVDIFLKQIKHRIVESLSSDAADFFGLSRAVLVNDSLVKRLEAMNNCSNMFNDLSLLINKLNQSNKDLAEVHKIMAEIFDEIGVKESQPCATEAFTSFAKGQRTMQRYLDSSYAEINKIVQDLRTFYKKVVPDTKLTVKKYLDAKFHYLAYCLKIKELDDEESCYVAMHEPLYRIETGNYEYRLLLRFRQNSRKKFAKMRNDVMEKLELLDNKHVQDIVKHLGNFMDILKTHYSSNYEAWKLAKMFPIEIDITGMPTLMNPELFFIDSDLYENGNDDRSSPPHSGDLNGDYFRLNTKGSAVTPDSNHSSDSLFD